MKKIQYILFFLTIDYLTKFMAEAYAFNGPHLNLIHNQGLGFGVSGNQFTLFFFPLLILFPAYLCLKKADLLKHDLFIALSLSGMIGNYLGRFSEEGVIDFIHFPFTNFYFNFADAYQYIGFILLASECLKREIKIRREEKGLN